ncbi:PIG-L family deacetylase [Candidatus Omnitrophota bacterium]
MDTIIKKYMTIIFLAALLCIGNVHAQSIEMHSTAELQIALEKLNTLGSVLYLAAHPDDENTSVLAYLSKGKKYRTAYLSLTRGDGGQNLIGSEKGSEIGIIRTQELLAARSIDKAEQYFSRAIDFGYSKTHEETLDIWGEEAILADVVRVIRTFRPDVIITRFPPDSYGGHGHHSASVILAKKAFNDAANPDAFPEQLNDVRTWQTKRMFWNSWRPGQQDREKLLKVDVGDYDPLLGKSYTEIAAESRSMHKTQGFGASGRRGTNFDYFDLISGEPAATDLFEGIDTTWNRVPGGKKIGDMLGEIIESFDPHHPSGSVPGLLKVYEELNRFEKNDWVRFKKLELQNVIRNCAGLWIEAISDEYAVSPGEDVRIRATLVNRSDNPFELEKIRFPELGIESVEKAPLKNNNPTVIEKTVHLPDVMKISQPFWLEAPHSQGAFTIKNHDRIGPAENQPSLSMTATISCNRTLLDYTVPVLFRRTDRVDGEVYRPLEIRPPATAAFEDKVYMFGDNNPKDVTVSVKSHKPDITGNIRLRGPESWKIQPTIVPFTLTKKFEEDSITFTVTPPYVADEGVLAAEIEIDGTIYDKSLVEISYPHIKRQIYFPDSKVNVVKLDISKPAGTIGYIMGAGDEVPDGLRNLGYDVTILDDEAMDAVSLSRFDAVITGIRAYNTREQLRFARAALMKYIENGGTLIVQYNVSRGLITDEIGPYPFTIGRDRVTVESAPVSFINPDHQLLNYPNTITLKDFDGWVQERGLYFSTGWDDKYEAILSSHDPGETDKKGGMLFARYGKGVFIYTGYSWFRQLPAGVPGAYRLFVNMMSAGNYHDTQ